MHRRSLPRRFLAAASPASPSRPCSTATATPPTAKWSPPDGKPHFTPKAKSRHLALHERRRLATWRRSTPSPMLTKYAGKTIAETPFTDAQNPEKLKLARVDGHQRRQRPAAEQALPAAGRLQEVRQERHRGQRLAAAHRRVHRRHRRHPLDVHDRRQPRRPDAVPHRPAHARRRVPDARRLGPLRPRHAERQPAAVHLAWATASTGT